MALYCASDRLLLRAATPIPYEGYYFRILKARVPTGMAGKSYVQSGRMTSGFALIAWPAVFGSSGIMTFIVGPDGDVYQKDLGSETAERRSRNGEVRPGPYMGTCRDDERLTAPVPPTWSRLAAMSAVWFSSTNC